MATKSIGSSSEEGASNRTKEGVEMAEVIDGNIGAAGVTGNVD